MTTFIDTREKEEKDCRYWFFRFPEDFFDDDAILETETLINNTGYIYIVILLKLYCLTVRDGGTFTIPASNDGGIDYLNIGHRIRFNDTAILKAAIDHLSNVGLIYITNNPEPPSFSTEPKMMTTIFAPQVENMTGSVRPSSDVRRLQRGRQIETPANVEQKMMFGDFKNVLLSEAELQYLRKNVIDVDALISELSVSKLGSHNESVSDFDELLKKSYLKAANSMEEVDSAQNIPTGTFGNVKLSKEEWQKLCRTFSEPLKLVNHISNQIYKFNYKMPSHYAFAVKCGRDDGWETVAQRKEREAAEYANKVKMEKLEAMEEAEKEVEVRAYYQEKAKELGVESAEEAAAILRNRLKTELGSGSFLKEI